VTAVGHNPQRGARDGAVHVDGHFQGIKKIAVSINDERGRFDRTQHGRSQIHVVIAVGHPALPFPECEDLLIAERVAFPHELPLLWGLVLHCNLPHDGARRFGEMHRGADQHHAVEAFRLKGRHVQKNISSHAQADGAALRNIEVIEKREHIERALPMGDGLRRIAAAAMASSVRQDEQVLARELLAPGMNPVVVGAASTMKKEQRLSGAVDFAIHFDSVYERGFGSHESEV